MTRFLRVFYCGIVAACLGSLAVAQTVRDDLRGGGAYDTVSIAGFLISIDDVEALDRAHLLRLNPQTNRFTFSDQILSEREFGNRLTQIDLTDARAVRDLYRIAEVPLPKGAAHTLTVPSLCLRRSL